MDSYKYGSKIDKISLDFEDENSPIFIIGHWRSGTTYLHNIISQNPNILYPTLHTQLNEDCFVSGDNFLYNLLLKFKPEWNGKDGKVNHRGWDYVEQYLDSPVEDEVSVSTFNPFSYYKIHSFPSLHYQYKNLISMDITQKEIDDFKQYYSRMIKKLLYYNNNIHGRMNKTNPRYDTCNIWGI